jgi:hypothetical protein
MSLAELFYAKHPRRTVWSALRRGRASAPRAESQFRLESLEPRYLMSAGLTGVIEVLAQTGNAAPSSGGQSGGTFTSFGTPFINDAGETAFVANITGSTSVDGVFRSSGPGEITALSRFGEVAPASGGQSGGTLGNVQYLSGLNESGQAVYAAIVNGATSNSGIFASNAPNSVLAVVRRNEAAPSSGLQSGGTIGDFFGSPNFGPDNPNELGQTAFMGTESR